MQKLRDAPSPAFRFMGRQFPEWGNRNAFLRGIARKAVKAAAGSQQEPRLLTNRCLKGYSRLNNTDPVTNHMIKNLLWKRKRLAWAGFDLRFVPVPMTLPKLGC